MNNSDEFKKARQVLKERYADGSLEKAKYTLELFELIADRLGEIGEENEKVLEAREQQRMLDEFAAKHLTPQGTLKTT